MGSSGGGAGSDERWWENPKLSPADLRQHSETWSLADDAAMATLLQGISQRLVSRTHEVEGALERALEDTDRIVTTISNTNNAFHMLANTQFIENRTYQDDADVVREKKEVPEKPAVTEEDILTRCRMAITDGLNLVAASYERHEIQDSDSDDDDSPGSPVPVYALIDPYENKPLPLIIGSEGFLADDKVGLEVSSSEENSRMTFSPDDTESEEELEDETDRVSQHQRAIPASSSMALDDDSDSEWSEEDGPLPSKPSAVVSKPKMLEVSSDEDDDMFGPSSRNSEKVGNIFNQKSNTGPTIPTPHINSNNRAGADVDSDSEEDEGLFGKQQKSSGLFDGLRKPSHSQGSSRSSDSITPAAPAKSVGVENVRAMPDATPAKPSAPVQVQPKRKESNLFASDSDDEEDLFSSKPAASGKATNSASHSQNEVPTSNSGGLFSSDDDSPLFSGPSSTQVPKTSKEDHEEPPPLPKESSQRKVPVGGVNIFGSAITSALRRPKSSDDESSDDEVVPNANTTKDPLPPPTPASKPDDRAPQKPAANVKAPLKGGLFDSDEDEGLFDTLVRKPAVVANDVKKIQSVAVSSVPETKTKNEENKSHTDTAPVSNLGGKDIFAKSTAGLFSDEEDDIFGISTTVKNKAVSSPESESRLETSAKTSPGAQKPKEESAKPARPSSLFTPPDSQTPSEPVTISAPPKPDTSLFSSPSDDDDLFSTITKPAPKAAHSTAFITDPPPLPPQSRTPHRSPPPPPQSTTRQTEPPPIPPESSASHSDPPLLPQTSTSHTEPPPLPTQSGTSHIKESVSSSLFSSTSDEDIFSSVTSHKDSPKVAVPEPNKEKTKSLKPGEEPDLSTKTAAPVVNSTSQSEKEESGGIFHSPTDDIFKPISHPPSNESKPSAITNEASEGLSKSLPKKDVNLGATSKADNLFDSTEDLFGATESLPRPNDSSRSKASTHDPLKPNSGTSGEVIVEAVNPTGKALAEAVNPATSRLLGDSSDAPNKITLPPSPPSSPSKPSQASTQETKQSTTKPPVGGVALFGGKELAAQINKRKSMLEPDEEKEEKVKNVFDDIHDSASDGEDQSKAVIFDDSDDDDIFGTSAGNSRRSTSSSLFRQSPPLLPGEAERDLAKKQEPEGVQISKPKPVDLEGGVKKSDDIDSDKQKVTPDKSKGENKEEVPRKEIKDESREETANKEVKPKPKKKPPVGGVPLFGAAVMGGSELFEDITKEETASKEIKDESRDEDTNKEIKPKKKPPIGGVPMFGATGMGGNKLFEDESKEEVTSKEIKVESKEEVTNKEIKASPKKKPPIGGVPMFGATGMGGNELFDGESKEEVTSKEIKVESKEEVTNKEIKPTPKKKPPIGGVSLFGAAGMEGNKLFEDESKEEAAIEEIKEEIQDDTTNKEVKPKKKPPIGGVSMFGAAGSELFEGENKEKTPSIEIKDESKDESDTTNKEVKPRKKPPIGGVSMFGAGGMGGSELFAKVRQRKSMLAPESDSSEEDTPKEPAENSEPTTASEEKNTAVTKPVVSVSPGSPLSPMSPVFAPVLRESKSGGEESRVSFDDPATSSNVLQSLNKTRARGSIKRRPPSRAHRKGTTDRSDTSDTQDISPTTDTPSPAATMPSSPEHSQATDVNKTETAQPGERLQQPSPSKDQSKVPVEVEQNEVESASTDTQMGTLSKDSNSTEDPVVEPVSTSQKKNKEVPTADKTNVGNAPKSALKSSSKTSSKPSRSLFGGSDSDEDLFGEVKQKQDVKKKKSSASSGAKSAPKTASKSSKSHSLFDDDDDDASIFSSKSQVKKAPTSTSRTVPTSKPKGNLKQSSEPFEDPLLGGLTK